MFREAIKKQKAVPSPHHTYISAEKLESTRGVAWLPYSFYRRFEFGRRGGGLVL